MKKYLIKQWLPLAFDPKKCTGTAPFLEGVTLAKNRSRGCKHDIKRYSSMRF
jgi:hypothetical protein